MRCAGFEKKSQIIVRTFRVYIVNVRFARVSLRLQGATKKTTTEIKWNKNKEASRVGVAGCPKTIKQ